MKKIEELKYFQIKWEFKNPERKISEKITAKITNGEIKTKSRNKTNPRGKQKSI